MEPALEMSPVGWAAGCGVDGSCKCLCLCTLWSYVGAMWLFVDCALESHLHDIQWGSGETELWWTSGDGDTHTILRKVLGYCTSCILSLVYNSHGKPFCVLLPRFLTCVTYVKTALPLRQPLPGDRDASWYWCMRST